MSLDAKKLQKPFRKLHKSLKEFPAEPTPEQVHDLRTNSRKIEAAMQAIGLDEKREGRSLLKAVAPIRKSAGKVRDMDVLTGFASTLVMKGTEEQCVVQLLEHLGAQRARSAGKLANAIDEHRSQARRRLKDYSMLIEGSFVSSKDQTPEKGDWPATATAAALQLSRELAAWPSLRTDNLHPYRLKIKQLRYILQLRDDPDDELAGALGDVKDTIGEWHDWTELDAIASKVLDHGNQCKVLQRIRSTRREKFEHAMSLTAQLRRKHFPPPGGGHSTRRKQPVKLKEAVVITSAKLAA